MTEKLYPLRLYIYADDVSAEKRETLIQAIDLLRQDYEKVKDWGLEVTIVHEDMSLIPWVAWKDGDVIVPDSVLKDRAKKVKNLYGEQYHSVMMLFDPSNWEGETYRGLNMGRFFEGMSFQLCYWYNSPEDLKKLLSMEIGHCLDEQIYRELGVKIEDALGMQGDVDEVVFHERGADGRYTYDYIPFYKAASPWLRKTFKKRNKRYYEQRLVAQSEELRDAEDKTPVLLRWLDTFLRLFREKTVEFRKHNHKDV